MTASTSSTPSTSTVGPTRPAPTDRPSVEVRDLHRRYGGKSGFEAVRGVSFDVAPGELFALLGTNGAGKTSTLEVAEGLAPPTSGTVRILGLDPRRDRTEVRGRVGVMLQSGGLPQQLTAAETARMWAGALRRSRPPEEALEIVGLAAKRDVQVASLSGGERRRLDFALAIMGRPEVVFLDEPTTGMDPQSRRTTTELVRSLVGSGSAVVLTTHDLHEAEELADRIAIMHRGRIELEGTTADIAAHFPSTIAFRPPAGLRTEDVPLAVEVRSHRWVVETRALQGDLTRLLTWAADRDVTLSDLHARSASLEEAFLAVAGRQD